MNRYLVTVEMDYGIPDQYIVEAPTKIKAYVKCLNENKHLCGIIQIKSKKIN